MASKKTADKAVKKESGKKAVKATKKSAKAGKAESASKKSRQSKLDEDDENIDLISDVSEEENAPDQAMLDESMEAEEREASRLDLEEVAKQADRIENQQPADGDGTDADAKEELELAGAVPVASPAMANSDEYDPESVDVMADFKGRSVLGAEERNAVIQEVKQVAEKNGGYVTYEQLNSIVPQTVQDESTADEYLMGRGTYRSFG